jgi:hypothetical protein
MTIMMLIMRNVRDRLKNKLVMMLQMRKIVVLFVNKMMNSSEI